MACCSHRHTSLTFAKADHEDENLTASNPASRPRRPEQLFFRMSIFGVGSCTHSVGSWLSLSPSGILLVKRGGAKLPEEKATMHSPQSHLLIRILWKCDTWIPMCLIVEHVAMWRSRLGSWIGFSLFLLLAKERNPMIGSGRFSLIQFR